MMIRKSICHSLLVITLCSGCQLSSRKPYANDPLLRQRAALAGSKLPANVVQLPLDEPLHPNPPRAVAHRTAYQTAQLKTGSTIEPPRVADVAPLTKTPLAMEGPPLKMPEPAVTVDVLGPPPPPLPERTLRIPEATVATPAPAIEERVESAIPVSTPTPDLDSHALRPESGPLPTTVMGSYGHGPNHRWLQGALDRHYRGHMNLRYCDPAKEDDWGGKVRLLPDPLWDTLQDGDIVYVEGDVIPAKSEQSTESRDGYPSYRVHRVWVVKKK